jgi:hypothetical protein
MQEVGGSIPSPPTYPIEVRLGCRRAMMPSIGFAFDIGTCRADGG